MNETMFQRIEVGDVLQIKESNDEESPWKSAHMREWVVTEVYPYHIVCQSGNAVTSFTYGEMVQLGYEVEPQYEPKEVKGKHYFMDRIGG